MSARRLCAPVSSALCCTVLGTPLTAHSFEQTPHISAYLSAHYSSADPDDEQAEHTSVEADDKDSADEGPLSPSDTDAATLVFDPTENLSFDAALGVIFPAAATAAAAATATAAATGVMGATGGSGSNAAAAAGGADGDVPTVASRRRYGDVAVAPIHDGQSGDALAAAGTGAARRGGGFAAPAEEPSPKKRKS